MTDFTLDEAIDILAQCAAIEVSTAALREKAQSVVNAALEIEFIPEEPPPIPELRLVETKKPSDPKRSA